MNERVALMLNLILILLTAGLAAAQQPKGPPACPEQRLVFLKKTSSAPLKKQCLPSGWTDLPRRANGKCPTDAVQGSFPPPYGDKDHLVCFGPDPFKQKPTPKNRTAMAWLIQKDDELMKGGRLKYSVVGIEKRELKISMSKVSRKIAEEYFKLNLYALSLSKAGFKATVITNGKQYWAALLSEGVYQTPVQGPFSSLPSLKTLGASHSPSDSFKHKPTPGEENRLAVAHGMQEEISREKLLPGHNLKFSAVGIRKEEFEILTSEVDGEVLGIFFNRVKEFPKGLWKQGFKALILTDGKSLYWSVLLSEEGYQSAPRLYSERVPLKVLIADQKLLAKRRTQIKVDLYAPPDGPARAAARRSYAALVRQLMLHTVHNTPGIDLDLGLRVYATTPDSPQGEETRQDYRLTIEIQGLPLPEDVVPLLQNVMSVKKMYGLGFKEVYIKNTVGVRLGTIGCAVALQADGAHPLYCMRMGIVTYGLGDEGVLGTGYKEYYRWPKNFVVH